MKVILVSNSDSIIMDLPYEEILKFLEILKQDTSKYSKTVSIISDRGTKEDCEFIRHVTSYYNTRIECQIYKS